MKPHLTLVLGALIPLAAIACADDFDSSGASSSTGGAGSGGAGSGGGGAGGEGGSGANAGSGGVGGGEPCDGACSGTTPICDETSQECVECAGHADCTEPQAAQCESGTCVPCSESEQCEGVEGAGVCSEGTCVECALGEEEACSGTCDLLEHTCVSVAPGSVGNCEACSNDSQCEEQHHCVPMDFDGAPHGHYCLKTNADGCEDNPYRIEIPGKTTLSGNTGLIFCGINETLATCEAVLALVADEACPSGEDSECPEGGLCRKVGGSQNRCTYACNDVTQCKTAPNPGSTCGMEDPPGPPNWCGG